MQTNLGEHNIHTASHDHEIKSGNCEMNTEMR